MMFYSHHVRLCINNILWYKQLHSTHHQTHEHFIQTYDDSLNLCITISLCLLNTVYSDSLIFRYCRCCMLCSTAVSTQLYLIVREEEIKAIHKCLQLQNHFTKLCEHVTHLGGKSQFGYNKIK